jgi:hypothetical protein
MGQASQREEEQLGTGRRWEERRCGLSMGSGPVSQAGEAWCRLVKRVARGGLGVAWIVVGIWAARNG